MSSADFSNLSLRVTTSYNPDGSFVNKGYVFTVSTNGRQLWTNDLALNNLSASTFTLQSTFTVASNVVNTLTVNSTALVSSLSVSGLLSFSTLTGSTLQVASGGSIGSTLLVSTLNGSNGSFASTLTVSTLNGSNGSFTSLTVLGSGSVASTLTVSSLAMTADSYFSSTLYGSTLSSMNGQFQNLILNGSGVVSSTLSVSTLSTTTVAATNGGFQSLSVYGNASVASTLSASTISTTNGQFQSLTLNGSGSVASTLTVSSLQGVSSFFGSTMFSNIITVSTLYVSSVISGEAFGATGPTGAAGSGGGGGGGGGTGYTGPVGPTGASGQTAVLTMTPSATQTITAVNTAVKWGTTVVAQSTGETGFSYNSGTGLFTNTTADARPLLIEYAVALDVTGNGAVFVGLNGSTAAYGVQHVSANYFSGSATVLVPSGQTVGLYYSDTAPSVVVQTTSMISLSVLAAGSAGPTGAPGGTSAVSVLSATSAGQSITASTNTELLWPNSDPSQSQGVTGLTYSAGRYTNNTQLPLAFQIEYQVTLTSTSGGASFVGINGASSVFGQQYNDNNIFNNSVTILLAPGSYFSVWYADNGATTVSAGSRITVTLLVAGMGPTGIQGPVGQVATLARFPAANQAVSAATDTVVLFGSVEASQTVGSTGLTYTPLTGLFTNTSTAAVPILVEYALGLSTTGNGASYVGLTPFGSSTVTAYGTIVNTTNYFANSYIIQVAPGASFGVYYRDNSAITIQAAYSRMVATLLVAGQPGAAGPVGTVAAVAATPSVAQAVTANTVTVVAWDANDGGQSIGSTGLSYAGGLYTNTTAGTLPLLIEYGLVLNTTGNGSSYVGITPFGSSTVTAYGISTNLQNIFSNSFTIQLGPGATVGIYYVDASAVTIQTTSRLSITLLTAGTQGATGPLGTGPTGMTGPAGVTGPVGQVAKVSRVADGTQAIVAAATGVAVLFPTADSNQSGGNTGFTYSAGSGLFTNATSSALPVLVEYAIDLTTTQGGFSYVGLNGNVAAFGGAYNDTNSFSSSYTLLVPAGQTVGVYYLDNAATTTVKATSRVSVTVLMAGQQGATGMTGPTGMSLWQITAGGTGMFYSAGNVGIGTTNPTSALQVAGQAQIGNANQPSFVINLGLNGTLPNSTINYRSGYLYGNGQSIELNNQQGGGDLLFSAANAERMRITAAGNVGIGTNPPTAALHVKSSSSAVRISGALNNNSARPALSSTPGSYEIRGSSGDGDAYDDGFLRLSVGGGTSTANQSAIDMSGFSYNTDMSTNIRFLTAGTERMRINGSGSVGIGTTNPSNRLTVINTTSTLSGFYDDTAYRSASQILINNLAYNVQTNRGGTDHYTNLILCSNTAADSGFNCAGSVAFGAKNSFGGYYVQYGAINGVRVGNFYGGLSFATMIDNNDGLLRESMRIINGNVGIGSTTPSQLLDLTNASSLTPAIRIQNQYAAGYLSMGAVVGVNSYIGLQAGVNISSILTTPTLVVTNAGTVGIGTANPASNLSVVNTNTSPSTITGTSAYGGIHISPPIQTNAIAGITFGGNQNASEQRQSMAGIMSFLNTGLGANLNFQTTNTWTSGAQTRMTIDRNGNVGIGSTAPTQTLDVSGTARITGKTGIGGVPSAIYYLNVSGSDTDYSLNCNQGANQVFAIAPAGTPSNGGFGSTNAIMFVGRDTVTNRSINALGTVNANGADYAEYMYKSGDFILQKGDIVGINRDGKLTNQYDTSIAFVIKSTNPSYIGGDGWSSEAVVGKQPDRPAEDATEEEKEAYQVAYQAWKDRIEQERQKVDRIAFSGQVPVNVLGAEPGDYIVPVRTEEGGISGSIVKPADLSFDTYHRAVGKVINGLSDGRANVIVKIA